MFNIEEMKNKIHLGDCLEFMKNMPDKCVDLVLTDPPYGMKFQSGHRRERHKKIENDDNLNWIPEWVEQTKRILKDDGFLFSFCSFHYVDVFKAEIEKFLPVKNILIWQKNNTGMGDLYGDFAPQYEMIIFCNLGGKHLNGRRDSNILQFQRTDNALHPTQKPKDLISYLASKTMQSGGGIVMDMFSGSGTTAIACHDIGLDFICVEKDPDYHAASVKRLEQHQRQGILL